jgi:hypothetical protein
MFELLPAIITINLIVTIFYASYGLETSPIYKDKWKSLVGTVVVSLLGVPLIIYHMIKRIKK